MSCWQLAGEARAKNALLAVNAGLAAFKLPTASSQFEPRQTRNVHEYRYASFF
jgi:hypothetical protein